MRIYLASHAILLLLLCSTVSSGSNKKISKGKTAEENKNIIFPPCASCKLLVESFKRVSVFQTSI